MMSSPSKRAINSPRAAWMPVFRGRAGPPLWSTRMLRTVFPNAAATAAVSSVEPSSITITSTSLTD